MNLIVEVPAFTVFPVPIFQVGEAYGSVTRLLPRFIVEAEEPPVTQVTDTLLLLVVNVPPWIRKYRADAISRASQSVSVQLPNVI